MGIWGHYGNRYPQLSHYLGDWVFDYMRVNELDYPVDQLLARVPELSDCGLNVVLTELVERRAPLALPVWALEKLSQYRITSSKFYQKGNYALVNTKLPGAVAAVDGALREKSGKGILETYAALKLRTESINAFSGALTESPRIYRVKYRNYTSGLKLQSFLKNLVRYIENALRAHCRYSTRLQGVELAEPVRAYVDAYLKATLAKPKAVETAKEAPKIVLDLSSVNRLRAESNQVRDALIASVGEEQTSGEIPAEALVQRLFVEGEVCPAGEAQTVGGLTIRPVGPPESDGGAHRRPWIAFDGAQTIVASSPDRLAALPDLRAAQPAIPGSPVSVLVPSLERLLLSGGRLVEKDDGESASALGPRTYFLPPEQAIPNELGGTFSIMAAGMRGREAGSLAFGLSATPADGILFAAVARPADPAHSLYATNPPPPLAAADLAAVPADALVWSASTAGSGRCAGVVSADSIYLGFNDTPANHARKAAFDAFFAALDAASAERGRAVRFLAPAEGGALRWESRVGTRRPDAERKLAAAYAALCRTESEIAGTNTPAMWPKCRFLLP